MSDAAVVLGVVAVVGVGFVVWMLVMGWVDARRERREEAAMRARWRGWP